MGWKENIKAFAGMAGDVAQDLAKNAGEAAQELAKAAQEKTAYLKELQKLKSAIKEQEKVIAGAKAAIADGILALEGDTISPEIKELCAKVAEAKSMIVGLKNQIESLRADAAKNPEVEKEISKAIEEIDRETAVDIEDYHVAEPTEEAQVEAQEEAQEAESVAAPQEDMPQE